MRGVNSAHDGLSMTKDTGRKPSTPCSSFSFQPQAKPKSEGHTSRPAQQPYKKTWSGHRFRPDSCQPQKKNLLQLASFLESPYICLTQKNTRKHDKHRPIKYPPGMAGKPALDFLLNQHPSKPIRHLQHRGHRRLRPPRRRSPLERKLHVQKTES